jgi:hypothetical protein
MFMHSTPKTINRVNVSAKRSGFSLMEFGTVANSLNGFRVSALATQGLPDSESMRVAGKMNTDQRCVWNSDSSYKQTKVVELGELP